jgi:hypothetical protein
MSRSSLNASKKMAAKLDKVSRMPHRNAYELNVHRPGDYIAKSVMQMRASVPNGET